MNKTSQLAQRIGYYGNGILRQLLPTAHAIRQRDDLIKQAASHPDADEIGWRVSYYNKLSQPFNASQTTKISNIARGKSRYFLDLDEYTKGFGPDRKLAYLFGDICTVPEVPTVVKSRPVGSDNANSILLKLNKLRHFQWTADPIPFREKKPAAVWRGTPLTQQRRDFVKMHYDHPTFDIGHSRHVVDGLAAKRALTHAEQMQYKFFVSLEGNDVATNLKWAMASNMLVMSPMPAFETWFMEGQLIPGTHFVLLKDDLSDLEEKVDYYSSHASEAEEIIAAANRWVDMFTDPRKESIISIRVLEKYFRLSSQL